METTVETTITEKIISGLRKAALELEELSLQASLGKAEARDLFEETKKSFRKFVHGAKLNFIMAEEKADHLTTKIKAALEELELQLALGKADTKELFEEQAEKIRKTIDKVEALLKKNKTVNAYYAKLQIEIEKFRIKLEIHRMQHKLTRLKVKEAVNKKKSDFSEKFEEIKKRLLKKEKNAQESWADFKDEIAAAFSHLKKALVK